MAKQPGKRDTDELPAIGPVDWQAINRLLLETAEILDPDRASPAVRADLLQRRAEQAAQVSRQPDNVYTSVSILTFRLEVERYAVPVSSVLSVNVIHDLTPVPCVPPFYYGVTNLKGQIMSVLDLLVLFGIRPAVALDVNKITPRIIVVVEGAGLEIGLLVDEIGTVTQLSSERLVSAETLEHEWLSVVSAMTPDGLVLLDVEQLLRDPRLRIYEEAR
ncbi:MAG: hypothetical protein GYB66_03560 [Chloroflexi bacterium]|nr:hypothetical protein [Chloroflexota bacterium]